MTPIAQRPSLKQYVISLVSYVAYMMLLLAMLASVGLGYVLYDALTHK